jgi:hypothetical protein
MCNKKFFHNWDKWFHNRWITVTAYDYDIPTRTTQELKRICKDCGLVKYKRIHFNYLFKDNNSNDRI